MYKDRFKGAYDNEHDQAKVTVHDDREEDTGYQEEWEVITVFMGQPSAQTSLPKAA